MWNFFGMSHGESPYDGVRSVVKFMAVKRRKHDEVILTAQ
jgi:hypothetical protein